MSDIVAQKRRGRNPRILGLGGSAADRPGGLAFMAIGTTLVYSFLLLWGAILIAYVLLSSLREERDLAQLFPDTYPGCKQRSKMLVPFVL